MHSGNDGLGFFKPEKGLTRSNAGFISSAVNEMRPSADHLNDFIEGWRKEGSGRW
jgi:hypothetical protein